MLVVFIGEFVSSVSGTTSAASQLSISIQFGYSIFILVTVTAPISGGHINPAVTLSLFLSGRCSLIRGALYRYGVRNRDRAPVAHDARRHRG